MKNVSREFLRGNKQGLKLLNDLNMHILLKWYLVVFFYIKSFAFLKTLLRFMLRLFWSYLCNSKRSNFLLKLYSPLHIGYSTVDIQHIVFKSSLIWVVSFLMMNQHMSCIFKNALRCPRHCGAAQWLTFISTHLIFDNQNHILRIHKM